MIVMANTKPPRFKNEAQEAEWWANHQDFIADRFEQAKAAGTLGKGTVAMMLERQKLNPQITGNVGLYYCCYKLSQLGWNVMPTARNARSVDIIAYNRDATKFVGLQVKALNKRNPVPLGPSLEKVMGDFWIIVNKVSSSAPASFILRPSEVKRLAHRGEKEGRVSFWLQPTDYEQGRFRSLGAHRKWLSDRPTEIAYPTDTIKEGTTVWPK